MSVRHVHARRGEYIKVDRDDDVGCLPTLVALLIFIFVIGLILKSLGSWFILLLVVGGVITSLDKALK